MQLLHRSTTARCFTIEPSRSDTIALHTCSDKVFRAMTTCPRGHFVPRRHRDESYVDMPIRVDQFGFNISAPHMHATALEALDIKPGDRHAAPELYDSQHAIAICLVCTVACGRSCEASVCTHLHSRCLAQGAGCWLWLRSVDCLCCLLGECKRPLPLVAGLLRHVTTPILYMPSTVHRASMALPSAALLRCMLVSCIRCTLCDCVLLLPPSGRTHWRGGRCGHQGRVHHHEQGRHRSPHRVQLDVSSSRSPATEPHHTAARQLGRAHSSL